MVGTVTPVCSPKKKTFNILGAVSYHATFYTRTVHLLFQIYHQYSSMVFCAANAQSQSSLLYIHIQSWRFVEVLF